MNKLSPYKIPVGRYLKNGTYKPPGKASIKWFSEPMRTIYVTKEGDYQNIKYEKFNPGSRNHIKKWMYEDHNFTFPYYTKTGNIKADADSLKNMTIPAGKQLHRYLKVVKDQSQVGGEEGGWLINFNKNTHSIHHRVDLIGAVTHRASHSKPNLAQVPAAGAFRSLFTVAPGRVLIGADLKNIEIRVLAHYLAPYDKGKYAEAVLSRDMHWLTTFI